MIGGMYVGGRKQRAMKHPLLVLKLLYTLYTLYGAASLYTNIGYYSPPSFICRYRIRVTDGAVLWKVRRFAGVYYITSVPKARSEGVKGTKSITTRVI